MLHSTLFSPFTSLSFTPPHQHSVSSFSHAIRTFTCIITIEDNSPSHELNKYNSRITEPKSQGASQAVLYGVGLSQDDLSKPQVGVSSAWYEGNTCNMHLLRLSDAVKEGVKEAGMIPFRFNTVGASDAISMGTRGMCFSLQSCYLIVDSIETVMSAQWYEANISIPSCDKNVCHFFVSQLCYIALSLFIFLFFFICKYFYFYFIGEGEKTHSSGFEP